MSQEELRAFMKSALEERIALFKELQEKLGPAVLETVAARTSRLAQEQMQNGDIVDRGLQGVIDQLWANLGENFVYTTEEHTDKKLSFKVTTCPWATMYRMHNAGDIGYAFYCAYDYGFCQGLNPNIKFSRSKTLMVGDDCCDHTYELTDGE
jgi:predicted ArsR family transcriptional regulator